MTAIFIFSPQSWIEKENPGGIVLVLVVYSEWSERSNALTVGQAASAWPNSAACKPAKERSSGHGDGAAMMVTSAGQSGAQQGKMAATIFISAGEASGEHYGALLIAALQEQLAAAGQAASFFGMGGARMAASGLECVVRSEEMAVMGLTEVVRHLPRIWREFQRLKQAVRTRPPSVAVLIDFPEIHFRLAKELHRLGVPVIFFVSPQLWAWKKKRIRLVQEYIDRMLVIFPFEEPFYRERGVEAEFVGHPLAELAAPAVSRSEFAAANGLNPAKTWIGLLPGSRAKEIRDHLPEMLRAARELAAHARGATDGGMEFIVPLAPTLNEAQRDEVRQMVEAHAGGLTLRLIDDLGAEGAAGPTAGVAGGAIGLTAAGARAVLFHARASVVASGTATVEAALIGNPFVVVYRVSPLTYAIARRLVKVPHVAMVNLIAGKRVVPELIQSDFTAENIVREIERLIPDSPPRQSMMEELARIHDLLQTGRGEGDAGAAIARVAAITLETMSRTG
jgi:lipid-A-disaccharide synthase